MTTDERTFDEIVDVIDSDLDKLPPNQARLFSEIADVLREIGSRLGQKRSCDSGTTESELKLLK